ncbi:MAG: UDP-N-acetylglucosamine--N-acetylmuramyl-(pentapeptide) pyrophosphoryl-undecaprenol N-acetylglucosamine transferase [Phycisphaerales bacterium]|nr:UDP-N-acetylglucosamine--N-acetylmuramyl-(pentapeptide) pyrophosphoryl-undecaprenol N-acetylglucosamine transferase [Phycisphaerales bacterium]
MKRFIFAGGGTGGHLFPSLAIWERIRDEPGGADAEALFVCSDRPLDGEILHRAGVEFQACTAVPPSVRPISAARFARRWRVSVRLGCCVLADPSSEVVAMGGFVAAPIVRAACKLHRRITLVNLDAVPGRANRYIARRAGCVLSAVRTVDDAQPLFREVVGMPIRRAARAADSAPCCRERLGLAPDIRTLLITGASQGAASVNRWVLHILCVQPDLFAGWQVLHLTGDRDAAGLAEAYDRAGIASRVLSFCDAMGDAWGGADAAITRAGAGSVAEAAVNRVPALYLPYPYHKDEHQRHNALRVTEAGGGILGEDRIEPEATHAANAPLLADLLGQSDHREAMRQALARIEDGRGAERIACTLLG